MTKLEKCRCTTVYDPIEDKTDDGDWFIHCGHMACPKYVMGPDREQQRVRWAKLNRRKVTR